MQFWPRTKENIAVTSSIAEPLRIIELELPFDGLIVALEAPAALYAT
jgi:hypothetical protein